MMRLFLFILSCSVTAAVAAAPQDPLVYGRAYVAEGNYAAAAQSYAEVLRLNPFDPVALNNMAVAKAASGHYLAALDLLVQAQQLAPERTDISDNLAHLQEWARTAGKPDEAATDFRHTLIADPPALWPAVPGQTSGPIRPRN